VSRCRTPLRRSCPSRRNRADGSVSAVSLATSVPAGRCVCTRTDGCFSEHLARPLRGCRPWAMLRLARRCSLASLVAVFSADDTVFAESVVVSAHLHSADSRRACAGVRVTLTPLSLSRRLASTGPRCRRVGQSSRPASGGLTALPGCEHRTEPPPARLCPPAALVFRRSCVARTRDELGTARCWGREARHRRRPAGEKQSHRWTHWPYAATLVRPVLEKRLLHSCVCSGAL
jgi:hypothetical protein